MRILILLLLLLLMPSVCMARKYKLLVINRDNVTREIVTIHESGGYYDLTKVLWDERVDGELPDIADIQGTRRTGDRLTHSDAQRAAHDSLVVIENNTQATRRAARDAVLAKLDITRAEFRILMQIGN